MNMFIEKLKKLVVGNLLYLNFIFPHGAMSINMTLCFLPHFSNW